MLSTLDTVPTAVMQDDGDEKWSFVLKKWRRSGDAGSDLATDSTDSTVRTYRRLSPLHFCAMMTL